MAFLRAEAVEQGSNASPCGLGGSLCGFAHEVFELGKDLFDGVQIGAIGWQEQQSRPDAADCSTDGRPLVATQVVHDDDITGRERGHEQLLDIIEEARCIDRLIEHAGRVDPVATQGGKERHRAPVAVWHLGMKPLPLWRPATQGSHVGLGPGLVDEDEASGIKPVLELLPLRATPGDLRPQLFSGQYAFF